MKKPDIKSNENVDSSEQQIWVNDLSNDEIAEAYEEIIDALIESNDKLEKVRKILYRVGFREEAHECNYACQIGIKALKKAGCEI